MISRRWNQSFKLENHNLGSLDLTPCYDRIVAKAYNILQPMYRIVVKAYDYSCYLWSKTSTLFRCKMHNTPPSPLNKKEKKAITWGHETKWQNETSSHIQVFAVQLWQLCFTIMWWHHTVPPINLLCLW